MKNKYMEIEDEMTKQNMDSIALSETKKKGQGNEKLRNYTISFSMQNLGSPFWCERSFRNTSKITILYLKVSILKISATRVIKT